MQRICSRWKSSIGTEDHKKDVEKMKQLTANQKKAFEWWDSLSINEMKDYTKKYYPEFDDVLIYKMGAHWIESIYDLERLITEYKIVWEDYTNSHGIKNGSDPIVQMIIKAWWSGWRAWNGEKEKELGNVS